LGNTKNISIMITEEQLQEEQVVGQEAVNYPYHSLCTNKTEEPDQSLPLLQP
jgi:hypothetical protein